MSGGVGGLTSAIPLARPDPSYFFLLLPFFLTGWDSLSLLSPNRDEYKIVTKANITKNTPSAQSPNIRRLNIIPHIIKEKNITCLSSL